MNGYCWFNFPPPDISGCDFEEIFILNIPKNLIIKNGVSSSFVSEILNRAYLDYGDNFRYDTTERIRLYDKEEYYR